MSVCYIIGSAPFCTEWFPRPQQGDYVICADGGYDHLLPLGISPDLVIGDFDSASKIEDSYPCEVIRLLPEKDDTDTLSAIKTALSRGWREFSLYGMLGGRLDHTVANLQLLSYLLDHQARGTLFSGRTRVTMLGTGRLIFPKEEECYLSVFSFTDVCPDVTLRGVKYPLKHARVDSSYPIGVSNEIISPQAEILNNGGKLLVIQTPKESL